MLKNTSRKTRHRIAGALLAAPLALGAVAVQAQDFPARKPITLIVTYSAGATDTTARMVAPHIGERLGQKVVVENHPGASGNLGYAVGMKAPPDGYTVTWAVQGLASNPALFGEAPYDPIKSFQPITLVVKLTQMLVAGPSAPFNNLSEMLAMAKKEPGKLTYAETGGSARFAMEILQNMAQVKVTNVTFKGGAESLSSVMGGHVVMLFDSLSQMSQHLQSGKLKPIAWAGATRNKAFPNVPTIGETVAGYEYGGWMGTLVPAGTPRPIVDRLRTATLQALTNEQLVKQLVDGGNDVFTTTPEQFTELIQKEVVRYQQLAKQMGVSR